ncbi:MAG: hypothetical protein M3132_06070 [Actinomycetia bacterium]|nr:hypothetical protein [Actinomycetes bacterium]
MTGSLTDMIGFIVIGVLALVLAAVAIASSRWAVQRGWVYNKHNPRPGGAGMPMMVDQIYNPGIEHVIEEERSEATRADQKESGDGPDRGSRP